MIIINDALFYVTRKTSDSAFTLIDGREIALRFYYYPPPSTVCVPFLLRDSEFIVCLIGLRSELVARDRARVHTVLQALQCAGYFVKVVWIDSDASCVSVFICL